MVARGGKSGRGGRLEGYTGVTVRGGGTGGEHLLGGHVVGSQGEEGDWRVTVELQ